MPKRVHLSDSRVNRTLCGRSTDGLGITLSVSDLLAGKFPNLAGFVCVTCKREAEKRVVNIRKERQHG